MDSMVMNSLRNELTALKREKEQEKAKHRIEIENYKATVSFLMGQDRAMKDRLTRAYNLVSLLKDQLRELNEKTEGLTEDLCSARYQVTSVAEFLNKTAPGEADREKLVASCPAWMSTGINHAYLDLTASALMVRCIYPKLGAQKKATE